jgi:SAM-dependent methyltransferase
MLEKRKLNLGCGLKHLNDHINVDVVAEVEPDLVFDLNEFPYPLPDNHFQEVRAMDVIEHVKDVPALMREVWRISQHGAIVEFTTPHFSCVNSYTDPTHVRHMSSSSMDYFCKDHPFNFYGSDKFEILNKVIHFQPGPINKLVLRFARKWPHQYESHFAWIFPAWFLWFQLRVIREAPKTGA